MMLRLRTVDGLPLDAYESLAGRSFLGDHGPFAHRLCAEGLARMENGVFRLTDEGMLVSNRGTQKRGMSISSRKRGMSLIIIERGIPMPLPSLDKGDVPVYGIFLYMFQLIY